MFKRYKYRIYPTIKQIKLIDSHIDAQRFLYNLALETKLYAYISQKKSISYIALINQLPELKKECPWLKKLDSQSLQVPIINLDKAFTNFFKKQKAFPKFKSKHQRIQTYRTPHGDRVQFKGDRVQIPKFKEGIKIEKHREFEGKIKSATISRNATGKYYLSVLIEPINIIVEKKPINQSIGIDLGISHYLITSDGKKINNPKYLKNNIDRIKILQRRASRKVKGSNNRTKANKRVALLHERIANQRKDFLQKLSTEIINQYDTICIENLNIGGMIKNHKLAGSIGDAGWGMFVEMLKYKSEWYGNNLLQIPTFQASTKVCSTCGAMNHNLTLADREWICSKCNTKHDRDINAAKVIKQYCITNSGQVLSGKPAELPTMVGVMKQEQHQ